MLERFWIKVEKTQTCWNWKGAKNIHGGLVIVNNKHYRPNRLSYEIFKGKIPENKVVLSSCKNILCVNPSHLILTNKTNQNNNKTHCPQGHPYSGVNSEGKRICHTCQAQRMNDRYHNPATGQKQYQLDQQKINKDSVNANTRRWHAKNPDYFKNWEFEHPRSHVMDPPEIQQAKQQARIRDKNTCQKEGCKKTSKEISIHVHHIKLKAEYPELAADVDNLVCLCVTHHAQTHKERGDPYWRWIISNAGAYE